ncbi:uncharacterized protein LAESUDRAFT_645703, partial [Laetiporus sulphureus 93-53]
VLCDRNLIYNLGFSVLSAAVESLLKPQSLVPMEVTNVSTIVPNYHDLFIFDMLHEWDLSVWKQTLIHLLHLLVCNIASSVRPCPSTLYRFRQMPTFSHKTIHCFDANVSKLKKCYEVFPVNPP